MTSINGYTLFPHNGWANGGPLTYKRRWQSGITTGILGGEQRSALRALPLHELSCAFIAASLQERSRLDARVDQASKSGLGCIPFYGRSFTASAGVVAGAGVIYINANPAWAWAAGDYAILIQNDLTFDVVQLNSVTGGGLTLNTQPSTFNWASGSILWPLLFGKFSAKPQDALSAWHAKTEITITQLVAERNAQVGATPAAVPGVGKQVVGKTNRL